MASALGNEGPSEDEPTDAPTEEEEAPRRAPGGWQRIAKASKSGSGSDADAAPSDSRPSPSPSGWGGVANKLGRTEPSPASSSKPASKMADRSASRAKPPKAKAPRAEAAEATASTAGTAETAETKPPKGKTPKSKTPTAKTPAGKTSTARTSASRTSASRTSAARTAGVKAAVADAPEADAPDAAATGSVPDRLRRLVETPRRAVIGAGAGVVVIVAVVLVLVLVVFSGGGLSSKDAFSVNGQVTSIKDFNTQLNVIEQIDQVTPPAKSKKADYAMFQKAAAQSQATEALVLQLAKKRGVNFDQKQARDQLDQIVQSQFGGNRSTFDSTLAKANVTEDEVLQYVTEQGVGQALLAKVTKRPTVTTAQISSAYAANQSKLVSPETRALSVIELTDQNTANQVVSQLQGGASFATLAMQDSQDSSKSNGGSLGTFQKGQLPSYLDGPTFSAALNVPFGPISVSGAFLVGEVTAITPSAAYSNDQDTQSAIGNYLTDQVVRQQWIAYLTKQIKGASIKYNADYRPAHPEQAPQPPLPTLAAFVAQAHNASASQGSSNGASSGVTTPGG